MTVFDNTSQDTPLARIRQLKKINRSLQSGINLALYEGNCICPDEYRAIKEEQADNRRAIFTCLRAHVIGVRSLHCEIKPIPSGDGFEQGVQRAYNAYIDKRYKRPYF